MITTLKSETQVVFFDFLDAAEKIFRSCEHCGVPDYMEIVWLYSFVI